MEEPGKYRRRQVSKVNNTWTRQMADAHPGRDVMRTALYLSNLPPKPPNSSAVIFNW